MSSNPPINRCSSKDPPCDSWMKRVGALTKLQCDFGLTTLFQIFGWSWMYMNHCDAMRTSRFPFVQRHREVPKNRVQQVRYSCELHHTSQPTRLFQATSLHIHLRSSSFWAISNARTIATHHLFKNDTETRSTHKVPVYIVAWLNSHSFSFWMLFRNCSFLFIHISLYLYLHI